MPAEPLATLQGAAAVQAVEGSCRGATEVMEVDPGPPSHSRCGHPGSLALLPLQASLPAAERSDGEAASAVQRLPGQTKVNVTEVAFHFTSSQGF